jgi:3-hydroxybutyryl-CoA dehydrogenase
MNTTQSVLILGAGFMGSGIAQVCAQAGYRVSLMDVESRATDKALRTIASSIERLCEKGVVKEPPQIVIDRVTAVSDLSPAADADWVIECVLEKEELKKDLFRELESHALPETPLATNTSSVPISRIAESLKHPERLLGLHFFGPVPLMRLVEVVKGKETSDDVFERGVAFVSSLGKTPVRVRKDVPGFVMNRIFCAAFREALDLVAGGVVGPDEVDEGMKLGYGWSAGPFEIADNAGLDTVLLIAESLQALGEEKLAPDPLLIARMVNDGRLGRKSGEGFYRYAKDGKRLEPLPIPIEHEPER